MTKFEYMMTLLVNRFLFVIDGHFITRVSVDDSTVSMFFWKADGEAFQFNREAITAASLVKPTLTPEREAGERTVAIIRDTTDKPHEFMALKNVTSEFHQDAAQWMWEFD